MPGIFQEILQFLAGNIAINKDENRKSSFMKVEALIKGSDRSETSGTISYSVI